VSEGNLSHPEMRDEIDRLAEACLRNDISEHDLTHLEHLVRTDPQARERYLTYIVQSACLARWADASAEQQGDDTPASFGIDMELLRRLQAHYPHDDDAATAPLPLSRSTRPAAQAAGWRGLVREFVREPVALAVLVVALISGGVLIWNLSQMGRPQQQTASVSGEPRASARGGSTPSGGVSNLRAGSEHERTAQTPPEADAPGAPKKDASRSPVIARLTRAVGASWHNPTAMQDGAALRAGQRLSLQQGLAEVAFESGATVILEGPAEFKVGGQGSGVSSQKSEVREQGSGVRGQQSEVRDQGSGVKGHPKSEISNPKSEIHNACSLSLGKLVARVPPQAHGFTVETPTMTVVDQGTEFAVSVQPLPASPPASGLQPSAFSATEVAVFEGRVDVTPRDRVAGAPPAAPVPLRAGEALGNDSVNQTPHPVPSTLASFVRELPQSNLAQALPMWPKDSPLQPGDIVVVTARSQRLIKVDPKSGEQKLLAQGTPFVSGVSDHGTHWWSVAVEREGQVLVGIEGLHGKEAGVLRIDPRSGQIKVLASGGLLKQGGVRGLTVAADGTIYAAYAADAHGLGDHLIRINPRIGQAESVARYGPGAAGICADTHGQGVLFTASATGMVHVLKDGTDVAWDVDPRLRNVSGVAVSTEGRVFLASARQPQVDIRQTREILEVERGGDHQLKVVATLPEAKDPGGMWNIAMEADGKLIAGPWWQDPRVYRVDVKTGRVDIVSAGELIEREAGVAIAPGLRVDSK